MDKTDRLRDYGLAFLLYEQGLGLCGYELIRELFIFVKLILNSYLPTYNTYYRNHLLSSLKPWLYCFGLIPTDALKHFAKYLGSEKPQE